MTLELLCVKIYEEYISKGGESMKAPMIVAMPFLSSDSSWLVITMIKLINILV